MLYRAREVRLREFARATAALAKSLPEYSEERAIETERAQALYLYVEHFKFLVWFYGGGYKHVDTQRSESGDSEGS